MKRIIQIAMAFIFVASLFATSKPSLDGRAVVAEEGVLPKGLFAKTVGYLPGDSVSVTNPTTGVTINVLILGSLDPSAGVAILLSPEAADKLFIVPNANVQVKITKRTGLLDESSSGTAVITEDPDKNVMASIPDELEKELDTKLAQADLPVAQVIEEPVMEDLPVQEEPLVEIVPDEPVAQAIEEPVMEDIPVQDEPLVEIVTDEPVAQAIEEPVMEDISVQEEPLAEIVTDEPVAQAIEEPVMEDLPVQEEPLVEIVPDEPVAQAIEEPVMEDLPVQEEPLVEIVPDEPVAQAIEEPVMEDLPVQEDPFAPIILVPVEDNPPKTADLVVTPEPVFKESIPSTEKDKKEPVKTVSLGKRNIIPSLSQLESGKYYVQIATLAEEENINNIMDAYGQKYPLVMVPLKSGKAYQIMVGPLGVDEYGTILARFKSFGYKDAFLRKIR